MYVYRKRDADVSCELSPRISACEKSVCVNKHMCVFVLYLCLPVCILRDDGTRTCVSKRGARVNVNIATDSRRHSELLSLSLCVCVCVGGGV